MLFYTFDLVISAEKTNEHEQKKSIITFTFFFYKNIFFSNRRDEIEKYRGRKYKMFFSFLFVRLLFTRNSSRERRCCYEKSQFTTETERLKNKVRRMNEHT